MPHVEFSQRVLLGVALALALVALLRYRSGGYYSTRRRVALTLLRLATLAALLPVAGGLTWPGGPGPAELLVLADHSASIAPARAAARDAFLADLRRRAPAAAVRVVRFGAAPLAQRGADAGPLLPDPARTNLAAAIEMAKGLATPGRRAALLVLSDGEETDGVALATLPGLRQAGMQLFAYDLSSPAGAAASIRRVSVPRRVLPGERFELGVTVASGSPRTVRVRLLPEAVPPEIREARLDGREDREVSFALQAPRSGRLRYRLRLEDAGGSVLPAGERAFEVPVAAAVPVTVLTNNPYEARALTGLLGQAGIPVTVIEPEAWRMLPDPAGDPGVLLLDNVRAAAIGGEGMEKLERLVRTRGAGLLVLGGMLSLGAGDYGDTPLERLLPVTMEAPTRGADADLSLVIVLDASLSMFFRGRGEEVFVGRGPRKMDLAKAAILEIVGSLRPNDRLGLLESKDELTWVHRLGPVADRPDLEARVGGIKAYGGGINFYSSIREAAAALRADPAAIRHVMVLADANDIDQLEVENVGRSEELIREMAGERVTLSIFALGNPSDKDIAFLRHMAQLGRGDFYLVADVLSLPRYFRSEYQKKTGEQFREEEFVPLVRTLSPLLRGVDANRLPPVGGMNLVTVRTGAEELLVAPYGAPLLAQWRYGRGRTAVFTADSGAHWAGPWYSWPDAERFWTQLIHEVAPRPAPPPLEFRGDRAGDLVHLTLRRHDGRTLPLAAGQVRFEGAGPATVAPLARRGLHRFAAALPAGEPGSYALGVGGELLSGVGEVAGFLDLPPPAEFAPPGRGRLLLESLAQGTGGELVRAPETVVAWLAPRASAPQVSLFWFLLVALLALFGEALIRY
jgi:hypothetical protein